MASVSQNEKEFHSMMHAVAIEAPHAVAADGPHAAPHAVAGDGSHAVAVARDGSHAVARDRSHAVAADRRLRRGCRPSSLAPRARPSANVSARSARRQ